MGASERALGEALGRRAATRRSSSPSSAWATATSRTSATAAASGSMASIDKSLKQPRHRLRRRLHRALARPRDPVRGDDGARSTTSCSAGKARFVGVSNFKREDIEACMRVRRVDVAQYGWHMFDRRMQREIFPYCEEQGIGVMAYGSLAFGLLTGTFTEDMDFGSRGLARPAGEDGLDQALRHALRRRVVPAQRPGGRRAEGHRRPATTGACRSSRCAGRPRTRRSAPRSSAAAPSPRWRTTSARSAGRSPTRTSPRSTRSSSGTASRPSRTTGSRTTERREGSTHG